MKRFLLLITCLCIFVACAERSVRYELKVVPKPVQCENPRPEICTMEYVPVCGTLDDGEEKTYSNGCSACSDASVVSYQKEACQ